MLRKGSQGTCIKEPWTKPKGGRIEGGRWRWVGWGEAVVGKWRQLYLNDNKKRKRENINEIKLFNFKSFKFPPLFFFIITYLFYFNKSPLLLKNSYVRTFLYHTFLKSKISYEYTENNSLLYLWPYI